MREFTNSEELQYEVCVKLCRNLGFDRPEINTFETMYGPLWTITWGNGAYGIQSDELLFLMHSAAQCMVVHIRETMFGEVNDGKREAPVSKPKRGRKVTKAGGKSRVGHGRKKAAGKRKSVARKR